MATGWFYNNGGGDRLGPVTASELRELALQGQLQPTSLIWKEGMGDWVPASKVKDIVFAAVSKAVPPPLPTSSGAPIAPVPPVSPSSSKQGMSVLAWAMIGVGSACVFGIVAVVTWNLVRPRTLVEEIAHHSQQQNSKDGIAKAQAEVAKRDGETRRHIQECRWWWKKPSDAELAGLIDLIVSTNSGSYVIIDDLGQNEVVSTASSRNWREVTTKSLRTRRCCVTVSGSRRTTKEDALSELQTAVDGAEFKDGPAPKRVPVSDIKWQRFAHPDGVASIDMPGIAIIDNSHKATATFAFGDVSIVYELTVVALPEIPRQAIADTSATWEKAINAVDASHIRRKTNSNIISGEAIQLGEARGRELRVHDDVGVNVMRIYVHRQYIVVSAITFPFEAELTKQEMGRFFDSLKLTGDAQAVGGAVPMPNAPKANDTAPEVVDAVNPIPKKRASVELPRDRPVVMAPGESRTNVPEIVSKFTGMKLALIPSGTFTMGSPDSEAEHSGDESPLHTVRLSQPFYMAIHEVTQREYELVIQTNPSWFSKNGDGNREVKGRDTSQFPVENMSWYDAIEFCNELSVQDRLPKYYTLTNTKRGSGSIKSATVSVAGGDGYRLPTEAEWEYACRANSTTPFHFGSTSDGSEANVNGSVPYGKTEMSMNLKCTTKVGSNKQNAFGLFDMHGNVREWCGDAYNKKPYSPDSSGTTIDPNETTGGSYRVLRGGSWHSSSGDARAARRLGGADFGRDGSSGFRTVRSISPTDASGKAANLGRSTDVAVDTGELKGKIVANRDGNAKPAAAELLPDEFRTYFERADERKAELIMAAEAKIALKEIEVRGATPKSKAARKRELSDLEESLRDLKKSKPFDFLVENRDIKQTRETHTIGVLGSCAVQAVIDEHTIVANCGGGVGGQSFTAVLKMDSTKGIRANSKLTPSDVWQVTSTDGLEDEAVALLLKRSGAVRGKVKVLKVVKKGELEKYRAAYEATK